MNINTDFSVVNKIKPYNKVNSEFTLWAQATTNTHFLYMIKVIRSNKAIDKYDTFYSGPMKSWNDQEISGKYTYALCIT